MYLHFGHWKGFTPLQWPMCTDKLNFPSKQQAHFGHLCSTISLDERLDDIPDERPDDTVERVDERADDTIGAMRVLPTTVFSLQGNLRLL